MEPFIDSHCHLTFDDLYDQVDAVLARAEAAGVIECVTIATDPADAERALLISETHPSVHVAAGIHPHEADRAGQGWDAALLALTERDDVYAVGEMGLDYHYDFADRSSQKRVFCRQLEIAAQVRKPVVIHCREAQADAMKMLAEFTDLTGVVFHCFTGSLTEAAEIIERGYWLSLTGVVTFKKSDELREVARIIPADRLMVETDSPYLSPHPIRHKRPNEPAHVIHTAACIAGLRGLTMTDFSALTVSNTRRFFSLPCDSLETFDDE